MTQNIEPTLVERLRVSSDSEETMNSWDGLRAYLLEGGRGSLARDIFENILCGIDEERAEAAARIEALEQLLQVQSVTEPLYRPLRFVVAEGESLSQMRENLRNTELYKAGDVRLVWVNEGDLLIRATCPVLGCP